MKSTLKVKGWWWKLTWPFAHANYTTIGSTIYCPGSTDISEQTLNHELVHIEQQRRIGVVWFILAYLFLLPFIWNPFRWKWEVEAYSVSGWPQDDIRRVLRSSAYGWLRLHK